MESGIEGTLVAEVTYPTLKGNAVKGILAGESVSFGRGGACDLRFGHAPVLDPSVPRIAGTIVALDDRIVVNSPAHVGHRALEIHEGSKRTQIPVGKGISLRGNFEVIVRGESKNWVLNVVLLASSHEPETFPDDPSTAHVTLNLTSLQWQVLKAYYEPIRRGRGEPATHQEVAQYLGFHINTVRNKVYEIRDLMYMNGLQMIDTRDARVAVVEAARVHGLLHE